MPDASIEQELLAFPVARGYRGGLDGTGRGPNPVGGFRSFEVHPNLEIVPGERARGVLGQLVTARKPGGLGCRIELRKPAAAECDFDRSGQRAGGAAWRMEIEDRRLQPHRHVGMATGHALISHGWQLAGANNQQPIQVMAEVRHRLVVSIDASQGAPSLVLQGSKSAPFVNDEWLPLRAHDRHRHANTDAIHAKQLCFHMVLLYAHLLLPVVKMM